MTMFKEVLIDTVKKHGGWVNAHVHMDRAFTISPKTLSIYKKYDLKQKWDLVDAVKKNASVTDYYDRIARAIELMISQGVTAVGSFIDVDPVCRDRAILGAIKARDHYKKQIIIKYINQVLKGVIEPEARKWFDIATEYVDIIGGLPKRDQRDYGKGAEHIRLLLETGKRLKKKVHIHVDQFNTVADRETEQIAKMTIEHGMEGNVVAIHSISLAAHSKAYREKVYELLKRSKIMIVACPTAWIDSPRNETRMPFHNALTPIDELIPHGIPAALGTDNIADYMVPFCDGDMWGELKLLAAGCRYTEVDELIKIATINGRKALGI